MEENGRECKEFIRNRRKIIRNRRKNKRMSNKRIGNSMRGMKEKQEE